MSEIAEVVKLANRAIDAEERAAKAQAHAEHLERWSQQLQRDMRMWGEENLKGSEQEDFLFLVNDR